jgi:hypothetical protein
VLRTSALARTHAGFATCPHRHGTDFASAPVNMTMHNRGGQVTTDFARADIQSRSEGRVAKTIEDQTSKLPSDTFLWLAVGAMTASASLQLMGNKHVSLFIGQWAPTFLIFGLYNKLVKQLGSDRLENTV